MRRASEKIRPSACSATARAFLPGVLTTTTPCAVAASNVHLCSGSSADAHEPEIGGVGEGILEYEVGLHDQYRDAFSADAGSQIVRDR